MFLVIIGAMAGQDEAFRRRREPNLPGEIAALREVADRALRELEDALSRSNLERRCAVGIHFPRGYLRRINYFTDQKWDFVRKRELVKALAYRAQQIDLLQWLMNRFDIDLTVLEGTVFWGMIVVESICEALCFDCCVRLAKVKGIKSSALPHKFAGMINFLRNERVIDYGLAESLHWVRGVRNDLHTYVLLEKWMKSGRPGYSIEDFNRTVQLCDTLTEVLREYYATHRV